MRISPGYSDGQPVAYVPWLGGLLRWTRTVLTVLLLAGLGCGKGMQLRMTGQLGVDGPVRMIMHAPGGPVVAMSIAGHGRQSDNLVAVVDVDGLLLNEAAQGLGVAGDNPVALFDEKLTALACTSNVRAIVLRINSPGGSVAASEAMHRMLARFREKHQVPVVAALLDVGAGGAYYLAAGADRIVAQPSTVTGGIGVYINLFNLRETMAALNILDQSIKSGPNIDMGTANRALSPDATKQIQKIADEMHEQFKSVVRKARPGVVEADALDGRIVSGRQAVDLGLVDQLGDLTDAIALAGSLAGLLEPSVCMLRRQEDCARSAYGIAALPAIPQLLPANVPGLNRQRLPTFLYMWQPDPGM